ncbi:hypothetical protein HNQ93_003800 [Hymenobacter luteus]|uniref:Uncharacterized protein n=2 Tax=Hymenobacter TaxID=89966 RepID=A0A7W9WCI5_9BACT|nr:MULTISPECIES: hypothetical protein [Hymenobacter]MBB4603117.1 hypothetical protein [Hymenobacter latericoloratus]MBB6060924.1 hypothetical protein [Hymenobacter luteus]
MTDLYLRGLGFAPTDETSQARRPSFSQAWRYQHQRVAQDGARLFIEHPLGIDCCRLSAVVAPLAAQDVFATLPLHDKAALETAIAAYYAAHGGVGPLAPRPQPSTYRPYRRQE